MSNKDRRQIFVRTYVKELNDHADPEPLPGYLLRAVGQVSCEMSREPREGGPWVISAILPPSSVPSPVANLEGENGRRQDPGDDQGGQDNSREMAAEQGDAVNHVLQARLADSNTPPKVTRIFDSMVRFWSHRSIQIDGRCEMDYGYGFVFDATKGLAVLYRFKMHMLDEVVVTVASQHDVSARVILAHPAHNVAVIQFDATVVGKLLRECELAPPGGPALGPGADVYYVALNKLKRTVQKTKVINMNEKDSHEPDKALPSDFLPFYHHTCCLEYRPPKEEGRGVLLNDQGQIVGLAHCGSGDYFLPVDELRTVLDHVRNGRVDTMRFRDFDVSKVPLYYACRLVPDGQQWKRRTDSDCVMQIDKVPHSLPLPSRERHPLRAGDLLLEVDGKAVAGVA